MHPRYPGRRNDKFEDSIDFSLLDGLVLQFVSNIWLILRRRFFEHTSY